MVQRTRHINMDVLVLQRFVLCPGLKNEDRHKIGRFQTQKSLLGIRIWAITYLAIERARCLSQINAIKFLGNPAGQIFERQRKATLEVKTRYFVTTFEGQKQRDSRLTRYFCVFPHGILSICRDNLFLSRYMPCSAHFVGNRLLANYILRLAISILFVSCRGRKPIETW